MSAVRLSACLSLTGRFGRFGRRAADGLRAWQALVGDRAEVHIEDDRSEPARVRSMLPRLAARSGLLLGPYSTQLTRAAVDAVAGTDAILFNHGGAGDDVQALCPGQVVSVLAPTSRYAAPYVRACAELAPPAPLWVVRGPGQFGHQVADGGLREARRLGLAAVEVSAVDRPRWLDDVPERWDLLSAGRFEDDVAVVRAARAAPRPPRAVSSVAAGVRDFAAMVEHPDGIYGGVQWFAGSAGRPRIGPTEAAFTAAYRRLTGQPPDFLAVQAAAGAIIATRCAELAGTLAPDGLWAAATGLQTTTLLGPFAIDGRTGGQRALSPLLVRWTGAELRLVATG